MTFCIRLMKVKTIISVISSYILLNTRISTTSRCFFHHEPWWGDLHIRFRFVIAPEMTDLNLHQIHCILCISLKEVRGKVSVWGTGPSITTGIPADYSEVLLTQRLKLGTKVCLRAPCGWKDKWKICHSHRRRKKRRAPHTLPENIFSNIKRTIISGFTQSTRKQKNSMRPSACLLVVQIHSVNVLPAWGHRRAAGRQTGRVWQ